MEGTIGARKVVVVASGTSFPDYVFKQDYLLPTLDSVAKFIQINSHLTGIPSADYVGKNGLDLRVNQEALLKKIEELTPYAIQQNHDLELIKKQARDLQEQNLQMAEQNRKMAEQIKKLMDQNLVLKAQEERIERLEKLMSNK